MGSEAAPQLKWDKFRALMEEEFYPSYERQKMEQELRNHKMVGADYVTYTNRFHELTKLVPHLVTSESAQVERYIYGLNPQIREMVAATHPLTMRDAVLTVETLTKDIIKKVPPTKNKRSKERADHQGTAYKDNKKAKVGRSYTSSYSKCAKCNLYHQKTTPCPNCYKCNRIGHIAKGCQEEIKLEAPVKVEDPTVDKEACFECGSQGHLRNTCPKWKEATNSNPKDDDIHDWGWTYVIESDGTQHEIPILNRIDEYVNLNTNI